MNCNKLLYLLLILISFSSLQLWAEDEAQFRVPEPEEIEEALASGLIEYHDYLALLETVRKSRLTKADTLFLQSFPNLQIGYSSGIENVTPLADEAPSIANVDSDTAFHIQGNILSRNYGRLKGNGEFQRLGRVDVHSEMLSIYGEFEKSYNGNQRWLNRSVSFTSDLQSNTPLIIQLGSYRSKFGMGLVYGYHGQFFTKDVDRDDTEKLLFPNYGGGNGILIDAGRKQLLIDLERNARSAKLFTGISIPFTIHKHNVALSAGYGRLQNRIEDLSDDAVYFSVFSNICLRTPLIVEIAVSRWQKRFKTAASAQFSWKNYPTNLAVDFWRYENEYPAFFSGGMSSRRSETLEIKALDLSYQNRRAGETGVRIRSTHRINDRFLFTVLSGYYDRTSGMNRLEGKCGLEYTIGKQYSVILSGYLRRDDIKLGERVKQRLQGEIKRKSESLQSRLVFGYQYDKYYNRNDFILFIENRLVKSFGKLYVMCKLDKIKLDDLKNNYMYLSVSHETEVTDRFSTMVKYSRRYSRTTSDSDSNIARLDITWSF
ncbi:MAG: hypothetical protein KAR42_02245 [candidate division Zixibacteria bacterium]|nr:hypothetical protein [candidate division Zixibacteria bacterium]